MSYAEATLPEFDQEMASTRKVLERIPDDKLAWQAHPKSHTMGWNANHLAEILGWVEGNFMAPSWDFAPVGGEFYQSPKLTSRQEILDLFDRNVAAARKAIEPLRSGGLSHDADFFETHTMRRGVYVFVDTHMAEHLGQAIAYARMNGIVPPWSN